MKTVKGNGVTPQIVDYRRVLESAAQLLQREKQVVAKATEPGAVEQLAHFESRPPKGAKDDSRGPRMFGRLAAHAERAMLRRRAEKAQAADPGAQTEKISRHELAPLL